MTNDSLDREELPHGCTVYGCTVYGQSPSSLHVAAQPEPASSVPSDTIGYVAEVRSDNPAPSCRVCGVIMRPSEWSCPGCKTRTVVAYSVPGAPDAEIDAMRFAAEKEVDLLVEQLADKDRTIERLRADAQADDRDWTIIAQELGVEFVTREDIVKRVRAWRAELSQLKGEPK